MPRDFKFKRRKIARRWSFDVNSLRKDAENEVFRKQAERKRRHSHSNQGLGAVLLPWAVHDDEGINPMMDILSDLQAELTRPAKYLFDPHNEVCV